jgi:heme-degrading monooxygenase HmoA
MSSNSNTDSNIMTATFFETQDEFRKWLEKHHEKETELTYGA